LTMRLNFHSILIERQSDYREMLSRCSRIASDYSFVNLWAWAPEYGIEWAWHGDLVWLRQRKPYPAMWAPVGGWAEAVGADTITTAFEEDVRMIRVPEDLAQLLQEKAGRDVEIHETREHWDYLYDIEALVNLKGKGYHQKKNLVNRFEKTYAFEYHAMDGDMIDHALGMQEDWCTWRDCESSDILTAENNAIRRVLMAWKNFENLEGGALTVDKRIVAYTIAEILPDNTLLIHFEKASPDYKGSYQAMNQQFLIHSGKGHTIVNREQDLGSEGLRKAKSSYHPVDFIRKFEIRSLQKEKGDAQDFQTNALDLGAGS
jgi:uncharacterized protein